MSDACNRRACNVSRRAAQPSPQNCHPSKPKRWLQPAGAELLPGSVRGQLPEISNFREADQSGQLCTVATRVLPEAESNCS